MLGVPVTDRITILGTQKYTPSTGTARYLQCTRRTSLHLFPRFVSQVVHAGMAMCVKYLPLFRYSSCTSWFSHLNAL